MNCPADERFRRTCLTVVKCMTGSRGEKDSWWRKVPVVKGDEVERKEPELTSIGNPQWWICPRVQDFCFNCFYFRNGKATSKSTRRKNISRRCPRKVSLIAEKNVTSCKNYRQATRPRTFCSVLFDNKAHCFKLWSRKDEWSIIQYVLVTDISLVDFVPLNLRGWLKTASASQPPAR